MVFRVPSAASASSCAFTFAVNNYTAFTITADTQGWQHFSYTMTNSYNFQTDRFGWSYRKPNTDDADTSVILLDEVSVTYNHPVPFDEVLYDEYSFLHFTSEGEHPFVTNRHSDIHPI